MRAPRDFCSGNEGRPTLGALGICKHGSFVPLTRHTFANVQRELTRVYLAK